MLVLLMLMLMPMFIMVALALMLLFDASHGATCAVANDANADAKIPNVDCSPSCWCICYEVVAAVIVDVDVA